MITITLPGEGPALSFDLPEHELGEVVAPNAVEPAADPEAEVRRALANPVGTARLEDIAVGARKVAIIVDDVTRQTPTRLILPVVLEALAQAGVAKEAVSIVIALGTHRPHTTAENLAKLGPEVVSAYRVINTPASQKNALTFLGRSDRGIPAWVNRWVAGADRRLGLGMIAPHLDAGFGGGAKIVLPGVCGQATVEAFHGQMAGIPANQLGLAEAALRLDLEAFVADRVPLHMIVNVVLDREGRIHRCVAGHPVQAHRAGVAHARRVYGAPVRRRYPVVVAHAHPHQIDFWQATKALAAAELMAQEGASLILSAQCPEGLGNHPHFAEYVGMGLSGLLELLRRGDAADRVAAAEAVAMVRLRQRFRCAMVCPGIGPAQAALMGIAHYESLGQALAAELAGRAERKVGVLTHGGVLVPLVWEGGCPGASANPNPWVLAHHA